jgi:CubicO group peptidase (beta-lactamase class C family)
MGAVRSAGALLACVLLAACSGGGGGEGGGGAGDGDTGVAPPTTASPTTSATAPPGFPPQPDGVPWPTEEWATAPLPAGVDRAAVDAATDTALAGGGPDRVRALVVVHDGAIVHERYSPHPGDGPDVVMPSYSIAKSVTSAMVGVLVREGGLDLDDPAPVAEWQADAADPRAAITVDDMLHMATGMDWEDDLTVAGSDMSAMVATGDMAAYAAAQELSAEPGERFDYNTGTSTLLARIVGDEAGGSPGATRAFLDRELFDVIGMGPVDTEFDAAGTWLGGFSADTTARGYAKFGLLYVRGGQWDGRQVLPVDWVEYSRAPSPANPEYGAHWWLDPARPGVSYAVGIRGQVITVDPAHDLVIVQLGTVGGPLALALTEALLDAFAATG